MARIRILLLLCIALPTSASALAAGVPELRGSSFSVTGVYSLTFNLNIASALPAGTTIICRARIVPNQAGLDLRGQQPAAIPVATAAGLASVNGPSATCAAEIPFSWTVTGARDGVVLSYEIDAVTNSGSFPLLIKRSGQQSVGVAFPTSGGSARLNFNLAF